MQVKVTNKVITLEQEKIGTNNVNTIECEFDLCEEFEGLTPIAVFTANGTTYKENIIENKCMIPHEVLENEGIVELGVYGFEVTGEELVKRYSPVSTYFPVEKGSYKEGEESVDATPNSFEYYLNACNTAKENAEIAETNAETAEANAQASAESASASATNVETIASNFNANATEKTNNFNSNAETKQTEFNTNASAKETAFNSNATEKTNAFNSNAESKKTDFDSNATTKTTEFNANYETKKALIDEVSTSVVQERNISDNKYAFALEGNTEGQMINLNDVQEGTDIKDYKIYGNTVQNTTVQGNNLCPNINSDKWVLADGAYRDANGYIVLPNIGSNATIDVEWNGTTGIDGYYAVYFGFLLNAEVSGNKPHVKAVYLDVDKNVLAQNGSIVSLSADLEYWFSYGFRYHETSDYGATIRDAKYIRFVINRSGTTVNEFKFKDPQVSKTVATTYEPFVPNSPSPEYPSEIKAVGDLVSEGEHAGKYRVPVVCSNGTDTITTDIYLDRPLYKIGDVADYIDFGNGKMIKNTAKYVFDGTENYGLYTGGRTTYGYVVNKPISLGVNQYLPSLCNKFKTFSSSPSLSSREGLYFRAYPSYVTYYILSNTIATIEELKEILDGAYVTYELPTPTEEDITLPSIPTMTDTTTIEVDTTTPVSNIEVKYNKDINKAFANLQAQILALGGE